MKKGSKKSGHLPEPDEAWPGNRLPWSEAGPEVTLRAGNSESRTAPTPKCLLTISKASSSNTGLVIFLYSKTAYLTGQQMASGELLIEIVVYYDLHGIAFISSFTSRHLNRKSLCLFGNNFSDNCFCCTCLASLGVTATNRIDSIFLPKEKSGPNSY